VLERIDFGGNDVGAVLGIIGDVEFGERADCAVAPATEIMCQRELIQGYAMPCTIPRGIEERPGPAIFGIAVRYIMDERRHRALGDIRIVIEIPAGLKIGIGPAVFRNANIEIVLEQLVFRARQVRICVPVIGSVKQAGAADDGKQIGARGNA
jgi:hypothetical protein